jgi:hypothetical protein
VHAVPAQRQQLEQRLEVPDASRIRKDEQDLGRLAGRSEFALGARARAVVRGCDQG